MSDIVLDNIGKINAWMTIIKNKWWLFLIVGLIGGAGGYFYAKKQKLKYQSHLTFALDGGGNEGGLGGAISLAAEFGLNIGGGKNVFTDENILQILKSRRMVEKVLLSVDTFNNKPYTLIEFFLEMSDFWKNNTNPAIANTHFPIGQDKKNFTYLQDSILYVVYNGFAANNISAQKPDKKLNIFAVSITSPHEKFTKDFTDRLVAETNNFYIEICSKKAQQTLEILEGRVASMKGNLNSSISSKASTQDANLNPAFAAAQVPVLRQQVNMQVYGGAYGEMFKNLELARYQYLKQVPLMQIIDAADYPMKRVKADKLKMAIIFSFIAICITVGVLWVWRVFKPQRLA